MRRQTGGHGGISAATQGASPSAVHIRADDVSLEATCRTVVAALQQMRAEPRSGLLVTIDPRRARLRVLALRN